jgi:hypothetical protein
VGRSLKAELGIRTIKIQFWTVSPLGLSQVLDTDYKSGIVFFPGINIMASKDYGFSFKGFGIKNGLPW